MTRGGRIGIGIVLLVAVGSLVTYIALNTYWDKITIPGALKNEAARDPYYGAEHLVEQLGASSSVDHLLREVAPDAVFFVSSWHWDLSEARRARMEQWVEAGGRLVLDRTLVGGQVEFERWSGISRRTPTARDKQEEENDDEEEEERLTKLRRPCRVLHDATPARDRNDGRRTSFELCGTEDASHLVTTRKIAWALDDDFGNQVLRVNVGKGSVTVINSVPFRYRDILEGDNAALLIAALQLRRKDDVHFLSEEEHSSMLALMWYLGWPVVLLVLALIALALWRNSVRFGPLVAEPEQARRSLAEQIRGTGLFVIRFGGGKALHAAAVRALYEAAGRRVSAWSRLSANERIDAVARLAGADAATLGPAVTDGPRRPHELRQALVLIESVRRRLLNEKNA